MRDVLPTRARLGLLAAAISILAPAVMAGPAFAGTLVATSSSTSVSTSTGSSSSSTTTVSTSSSTTRTSSAGTSAGSGASAANCSMPSLTQPFAAWGDTNEYALVPGQSFDDFAGGGWTLSGGASIGSATLADGTSGPVLDLPAGAQAVSPPMCVDYDFPDARMMVRNTSGVQDLNLLASYAGSGTEVNSGYSTNAQGTGWTPSPVLQTHPGSASGWQLVVFTIQVPRIATATQIYNFYVDPRVK